jgi:hypothetical protein
MLSSRHHSRYDTTFAMSAAKRDRLTSACPRDHTTDTFTVFDPSVCSRSA